MNFESALTALKNGSPIHRPNWNDYLFAFMVPGSSFLVSRPPLLGIFPEGTPINYHPHIDARLVNGRIVPWFPSHADLFAEDWEIAFEPA